MIVFKKTLCTKWAARWVRPQAHSISNPWFGWSHYWYLIFDFGRWYVSLKMYVNIYVTSLIGQLRKMSWYGSKSFDWTLSVKVKTLSHVWLFVTHSLPGFSIHGILQARILEWVSISFSRGSSWPRDRTGVSCIGGRRFNLWATREALWVSLSVKDNLKPLL